MIEELKTLRATCDRCKTEVVYTARNLRLPKDWTSHSWERVFGTGHYDSCIETTHLCPGCSKTSP